MLAYTAIGERLAGRNDASFVSGSSFHLSYASMQQWFGEPILSTDKYPSANTGVTANTGVYQAADGTSAGTIHSSAWNMWIRGKWDHFDSNGSSFDGDTVSLLGGVDYRPRENMIIGALAGYTRSNFDTNLRGTRGSFDSKGLNFGA